MRAPGLDLCLAEETFAYTVSAVELEQLGGDGWRKCAMRMSSCSGGLGWVSRVGWRAGSVYVERKDRNGGGEIFTSTRKPVSLGVKGSATGVELTDQGESKRSEYQPHRECGL